MENLKIIGFRQERVGGKIVDWVHYTSPSAITPSGEYTHSTWEKVSRLRPPEGFIDPGDSQNAQAANWREIGPAYDAWKAGNAPVDKGTPLGVWPGVSPEQADALRAVGISSVEALAGASEAMLSRPPLPNMRDLKAQAGRWIEARPVHELQEQMDRLAAENAAMREMLMQRLEKADAPQDEAGEAGETGDATEQDRPRRGRPPKDRSA